MSAAAVAEKTVCQIGRGEFLSKAKPLSANLVDQNVGLEVKQFSTGSFGWYASQKVTIMVDGKPVRVQVQVQVNATVVGSKEVQE